MTDIPFASDRVERWPIDSLTANPRNARTHDEAQIAEIVASMQEFGWTYPILIDEDGLIIAGHGRLLAAQRLGLDEVPVIFATGWSDEQKRAYMLADNKIALNAGWDEAALRIELGELRALDYRLDVTGFRLPDLELLLPPIGGDGDRPGNGQPSGAPTPGAEAARKSLMERFGIAPFSVLSARGGWWQERKRAWIALGIQSEVGRGGNLIGRSIFERCSIILSGTLGKGGTGAAYDAVRQFVLEQREAGLSDDEIEAEALRRAGRSPDGASGSQRLAAGAGGGLSDRMAAGEGTKRAPRKGGVPSNLALGQGGLSNQVGKSGDKKRVETTATVAGKGWADGGPARRDPAFYAKKREWEAANGRSISTKEFREKHWDGAK